MHLEQSIKWPRILRWQIDGKLIKTLSDGGSNDQPLNR
jgi:hypothetical protein